MRFDLTNEQREIKESLRRLCAPHHRATLALGGVPPRTDAFWPDLSTSGWVQLCVPERLHGQGAGIVELSLVVEELGYALAPATYLGNAAAALCLAHPSPPSERVADIAAGRVRAGFGVIQARGGALAVDAADAAVLVLARDGGAVVIDPAPRDAEDVPSVDITRTYTRLHDVGGVELTGDLATALDCVEVLLAAELVGVAQHAMELAVEHAKQRQQFGRAIGAYQAVSHRCADMLVLVESARSAMLSAAWTADHDAGNLPFAAAVAKVAAAEAAWQVTAAALQLHGGMGFTWEHPIHLFLRRAAASSRLLGSVDHHLDRVAALSGLGAQTA